VLEHVRGPETGSTGRPKEHQHSAAVRRDAGPTAPGEGRHMRLCRAGSDPPRMTHGRSRPSSPSPPICTWHGPVRARLMHRSPPPG